VVYCNIYYVYVLVVPQSMKDNKENSRSNKGEWIGIGVAFGAVVFVLTNEPLWIAAGVVIGAAFDWQKLKN
tara:strand:+ start:235 stop:447 length:213 start_codon:yes stop_codon:yes gene_type:complete